MHITTKQLLGMVVAANIIFLAVYGGLFMWLRTITLETSQLSSELAEGSEREAHLSTVIELLHDTALERQAMESYFVDEDNVVAVITELESLGETADIELSVGSVVLSEEPREQSPGLRTLTVRFATEGGWQETAHLLALLESFPRAAVIREVSLTHLAGRDVLTEAPGTWSGSVAIEVLVRTQETL